MNEPSSLPGIVAPPPLLYVTAFSIGGALEFLFPTSFAIHAARFAGVLVFALSAVIARWAFVTMKRQGTSANPGKESVALSVTGPFSFSRNPIYLAMTGLYIGASFLIDSWWPMLFLAPLLVIMHWGVISREERYLHSQFGEDYASYKASVRRWF